MNRKTFTVGCVPFANGIPLVAWFESMGDASPVRVIYEVPSKLPALLDSGVADAVMVSSIDALRVPGRRMADFVCIGSDGPVQSVRIFSKVPATEIKTLALDSNSLTSNRLAQIILHDRYGIRPELVEMQPDLHSMLERADACVLIGDAGMIDPGPEIKVLDLGEEWSQLTGLPFMWAAWIGNEGLTPELALLLATGASTSLAGKSPRSSFLNQFILKRWLNEASSYALPHFEQLLDFCVQKTGMDREVLRSYYQEAIIYDLTQPMLKGYQEFQRRLLSNGFENCCHFPAIISGLGADFQLLNESFLESHLKSK